MSSTFEQLFRLSTGLMATIDDHGRFIELNPAWEQTLGWTLDELRAAAPLELVHPDDREAAIAAGARMFAETTVQFESRYRCRDGRYKWLMWSCSLDVDAASERKLWYATAVDISAHKEMLRQREQMLERLRLFETMLENTPDQVGMVDTEGRIIFLNAAAQRAQRESGLAEGSAANAAYSPEFAERIAREIRPILQRDGTWSGEGGLLRADGSVMPTYQIIVGLKDPDGTLRGWGSLIRDMTEVKQIELQLRAAVQALATPLIPISDRVVVMPLIGQMDVERAAQATRAALAGVHGRGVEVVIVDLTGLQQVDAEVAGLLLGTARSLALLGVRTVLTGIQPFVAQTLVGLGLDLAGIETTSTLQSAIALALAPRRAAARERR